MRNLISKPMKLEEALARYGSQLRHTRAFYVLQANLEQGEVFKFGIAGISTGNAYNRLNEYVVVYGKFENGNTCKGVMLYYLGITEYNRLVLAEKSQVAQIELKLKQEYNSQTDTRAEGRGSERLKTSKVSIKDFLEKVRALNNEVEETPLEITKTTRETSQRYRTDTKSYIDSKTQAETTAAATPQRPVTRSQGNFNVTTIPTTPTTNTTAAVTPRITRSRTRNSNFTTTTI